MTIKLFCPHCGRCVGECSSTDETTICKILTRMPKAIKKKQCLHSMKCTKCKEALYISMEFVD